MPTVTHKRKYEQLKIYIDGIPHVHIKLLDLVGFQTWIHGEKEFYVEYHFAGGAKMTSAYQSRDLWTRVLDCLDAGITV